MPEMDIPTLWLSPQLRLVQSNSARRSQQVHNCSVSPAGIAHLMGSLKAEPSSKTVGVHTLSPGMVLTDLLLEGATQENKQIFNILCEQV